MVVDEYISRERGVAYGYEGYYFSGMVLALGTCLMIAANAHKFVHNGILVRIVMISMFAAMYYISEKGIKRMAQTKTTWNPSLKPSDHLYKGGLMKN